MKIEDRKQLKKLAIEQIKEDFKIIKKETEGEELYAFALGLVDDIAGFFSAGNTIEHLKETISPLDENDSIPPYETWGVPEWVEGGCSNSVSDFLTEITDFDTGLDDEKYDSFMKEYEQVLIEALQYCKENKFLGEEEFVIYIQYADAANEEIDDISSEKINSKELHNSFKNRYTEKEENNLTKIIAQKVTLTK